MSLNKSIYDFHLLAEGWLSTPPYDDGAAAPQAPADSVASIRMTEFSSDDKPDIWFKAEILTRGKYSDATTLIEKYGLPNAILVNCHAQKEQLWAQLLGS
ncbi:MAG: hypothetical protein JST89_12515 [Cyanobacteria bacterium SZAS-4]|nr:hypothetical protein [Cyanobacteria bacterium SZAS-4]